jgi:hypothetical protein
MLSADDVSARNQRHGQRDRDVKKGNPEFEGGVNA